MTKRILVICGRKQSGKDTLGNFLVSNATELFGSGFIVRKFGFADPLKDMVSELFRVPLKWMYGSDEGKNRLTEVRWGHLPHFPQLAEVGKAHGGERLTVRELLQQFGTEIVRRMDWNAWVNALYRKIERAECDLVVITDCRFPNEVLAVKGWGGKAIRLTRNQDVSAEHESEWALDRDRFDWGHFDGIIHNHQLGIEPQKGALVNFLREWKWAFQGESK